MRWRPGLSPVAPGSDVCPAHVDTVIGRVFCDRPLLPSGEHAPYDASDVIEGSGYHESLHRGGDGRGDNLVWHE